MLRIALIGCSKTKHEFPKGYHVCAGDLYAGPLFKKRVRYAEAKGIRWYVLSAKFGFMPPHVPVNPTALGKDGISSSYDLCMKDLSPADQAIWHVTVASDVIHLLWDNVELYGHKKPMNPKDLTVEIHAGADYARPLVEILTSVGVTVKTPVAGLGIGEQLAWYSNWLSSMQPTKAKA
jgi:hypothetical protein